MVRQLAANLADAAVESHVATTNDNAAGTLDVTCGVPLDEAGVTYWYFRRQARPYTFSWPLAAWLRRHVAEFDVVHIHALFSWAALPAAFWARRRGVPYIVRPLGTLNTWGMTQRRPRLKQWSFSLVERRIVAHAALMHYTSDEERVEAESLGVRTPAVVIPNPLPRQEPVVRGAFRRQHPHLADRPLVLFLSRIDPKKGVDLLLRAFVDVRHRVANAALVMAGDPSSAYAREMRQLAQSLDINRDVLWVGFLEGARKASALADADVFVLPSHSENFGIAVAEAMAAGLPVVVSDQVAICTDVADGECGFVVPCDAPAIADAVVRLLEDAELRTSAGSNGRILAAAKYSRAAVTREMLATYSRMVQ